jgi:hypothetical protein
VAEDNQLLSKKLQETEIDLSAYKEENLKLERELQEARKKLIKIETFVDVESMAFKMQSLELENRDLNMQNTRLMEQLYNQKKENQRIKLVESHLRNKEGEIRNLEKANQLLVERLKRMKGEEDRIDSTGYRLGQVEEGESEVRHLDELDITHISNQFQPEFKRDRSFYQKQACES